MNSPDMNNLAHEYPRILSAMQLLSEWDDESVFCGPAAAPNTEATMFIRRPKATIEWSQKLVLPKGPLQFDGQKFIGVFEVGLQDDEDFCLVKRLLGKSGNNMRRIAEDCNAKVRLRGIGSGFLEGKEGMEVNAPLQLHVSCTGYESYCSAVDAVARLLSEIYKHYRRYCRSRNLPVPLLRIQMEEVRRDDLSINLLREKSERTPSQRTRDRQKKQRGRSQWDDTVSEKQSVAHQEAIPWSRTSRMTGGVPMPTTAAGRRAFCKVSGAAGAAVASAFARQRNFGQSSEQHKVEDKSVFQGYVEISEYPRTPRTFHSSLASSQEECANKCSAESCVGEVSDELPLDVVPSVGKDKTNVLSEATSSLKSQKVFAPTKAELHAITVPSRMLWRPVV